MNKWISKMWSIHTGQSDSALKRKGILTAATTWISLKDVMRREEASHKRTNTL